MPHAKILTHQATHTLEQLHAELGGKIKDNAAEAKRLRADMVHVEAVLKMLQPGYDVRPIAVRRRKPNPWFKRGTVWRSALEVLRVADRPLTAREITDRMLVAKGVQEPASKAVRDLVGAVQTSLRNHDGSTVTALSQENPTKWALL